jgi:hypothetical protein
MTNAVTAFFVGQAIAGRGGETSPGNSGAVSSANRSASLASTGEAIAIDQRNVAEERVKNWRSYAGRLRVNLEARKMSEATLLEELKKANINHPLATESGFEEMFKKNLAEQYAELAGDGINTFDATEAERQKKSVEEGRGAVG